jgi:MFS family permease
LFPAGAQINDTKGTASMALARQSEGFLTLLKKRNFLRLWLAQLLSMTLLNASNYALLILIENTTHSTTLIGLAIISFSLPAVLLGAPAGVFVDRLNKRRVLWVSNCLRAIATFLFVLALLIDRNALLPIYLLTFIIASIGQFFTPAEGSAIPMLVSEEELMPALSLFNITFMLSQALGFVIFAPIMLSVLPTIILFHVTIDAILQLYIIVAVLYLICALLIVSIPQKHFKSSTSAPSTEGPTITTQTLGILHNVWDEMREGWRFVRGIKPLFQAVVQLSFAGVLILVISLLATPIVTQLLYLPANALALVFAPAGIGLILGSLIIPQITRKLGNLRTMLTGILAMTIATLLIPSIVLLARFLQPHGWNNNPLLTIAVSFFMFIAGIALDFVNIPASTAMQELSPDWIKGRVLALQIVLYSACSIPIILFVGVLSDLIGIDRVLYVMAACELAFGIWNIYYKRKHPDQSMPEERHNPESDIQKLDKIVVRVPDA